MPELPEVETTLRGILPHIDQQLVESVILRRPTLRWPIPRRLNHLIKNQRVMKVWRRGKYLLIGFQQGTLLLHLGMSGRLRVLTAATPPKLHDHVDICFANGTCLRFTDPRRFGAILWTDKDPSLHPLLASIGPEPLTRDFTGRYLWERAQGRKMPVKSFLMDGKTVAGVGNIYATEALFTARIRPQAPASSVTVGQYEALVEAVKDVLKNAIKKGGTTLKDFMKSDGTPGYFSIELKVYGRGGEKCVRCGAVLTSVRIGQRGTVYCGVCQV
jgi:formamidopyrimidine-DNA glycosylase